MTSEEFIMEFKKLNLHEQQKIMKVLMQDFCRNIKSNPAQMQEMMQMCSSMMDASAMTGEWKMPPFRQGVKR